VKIERRENGKDECLVGKGRREKMVGPYSSLRAHQISAPILERK